MYSASVNVPKWHDQTLQRIPILRFPLSALILARMADELTQALEYAAKDPKWLDRPVYQQRYIKALATEVFRQQREIQQLQDVLAVQDAQFQDERAMLKADLAAARKELETLREVAHPPNVPLQKWGPKAPEHPTIGTKCAACDIPFTAGDFTTAVAMGPGIDKEAREAAALGETYVTVALEVHWSCATGKEP
jgi:hypothetical protein